MLNILNLRKAPFSLIGVPIDSVGRGGGTELSPTYLREQGNWRRAVTSDRGDLDLHIRDSERNLETGIVGSGDVIHVTNVLRHEVARCFKEGYRPILLGGCCTQVVGAVAGARDTFGRIGLLYLDGHLDLYDGFTSPTGEAADMPLATLLGRGPSQWIKAAGGACVDSGDIALLGPRDVEDATLRRSLLPEDFDPPIPLWTNVDIQTKGPPRLPMTL